LGIYQRLVLPRLLHAGMRNKRLVPLRERQVAQAFGQVLEIGIGSGLNLPFYRRDIEAVIGIDPSLELLAMARKQTAWLHFPVKLLHGPAEALPLEDHSIDSVVIAWTLCSVAEPGQVLAEARRVLRPGHPLIFVEHGQAPEARVRRWQHRLTPLWRKLAGGCHLNRPVDRVIARAGFEIADLETGYLVKGPRFATYHYLGRAVAREQAPPPPIHGSSGRHRSALDLE
jgi:ubiquinone/menaquinone biosynthesis C-methylase UbiE